MTEFRIQSAGVSALGSRAQQLAADLENALISANREVASLSSTWTGEAGAAYLRGWEEMHDGGLRIFAALRTLGDSLGISASSVEQRDDKTSSSILSLG